MHRMIEMKTLIAGGAVLLLFNVVVRGQEESPSPTAEKKSYPEVPKGYEVREETISPDGRFALVYEVRDEDSNVDPGLPNLKEIETGDGVTWKGGRGGADAKWNGSDWVAVWHHRKWGDEDLVVYQIANDKITRVEKIWPQVVKYFDRDFRERFLKQYPKESDSYTFVADDPDVKSFEFKDDKLLLNIFADNKPNLAAGPHWTAELHAVWNLKTGKFDKVDFKPGKISIRKQEDS